MINFVCFSLRVHLEKLLDLILFLMTTPTTMFILISHYYYNDKFESKK